MKAIIWKLITLVESVDPNLVDKFEVCITL